MSKKGVLIVLSITSVLCLFGLLFLFIHLFSTSKQQTVYINNVTLFNEFNMSKDLGKRHKTEIAKVQKSFDSLVTVFKIMQEQKNESKILELQKQLQAKDKQLGQMNEYLTNQVSQQVWNRLNEYIKTFGEAHNYKFILGTQGNGNVMYADEELNVTEELVEYANNKYEGLN